MLFRVMVVQEVLDFATVAASVKVQEVALSSRCVAGTKGAGAGTAWIKGNKATRAKSESIFE